MATTTNYGWTTPDDTALVKDGAAAIRTLGSSVDTTTKALNPSTTLGDIEYRSSTANTNTRLGIGTSGQVLSVSGGVPAWVTASSGGMTLIQEVVANANSSITFSSIPQTHKQLLLLWTNVLHSTTGSQFSIRLNNNSNSVYAYVGGIFSTAGNSLTGGTDAEFKNAPFGQNSTNNNLTGTASGELLIDNYTSATLLKRYDVRFRYQNTTTNETRLDQYIGTFDSTTAITSIEIVRLSGSATLSNVTNTSIRLYGLS